MIGKSIAQVRVSDLQQLIDSQVPEGRNLEYKKAVPVSQEQQREQRRKEPNAEPIDQSVAEGKGIGTFGRDALLEELVGFANAGGGIILLGMAETADAPPRAANICAIPHVIALEGRFLAQIIDQIEPRLPFAAVRAIVLDEERGSGVLLIETQSSSVGPHWVRNTRKATVRREDKNYPLSMPEIHDMVMRNARRFDVLSARFDEASSTFEGRVLRRYKRSALSSDSQLGAVGYLFELSKSAYAIRATVIAHQELGLSRLENFRQLGQIGFLTEDGSRPDYAEDVKPRGKLRRMLGGVLSEADYDRFYISHKVERQGFVEVNFISTDSSPARISHQYFAATIANALAHYDSLRRLAGSQDMPGELELEIISLRDVTFSVDKIPPGTQAISLPYRSSFPRITVSDRASFDYCLEELSNDLRNACNLSSINQPYAMSFNGSN